jgi:hypothetical protein
MDTEAIIKELEAERTRLDQAITALRGRKRGAGTPTSQRNFHVARPFRFDIFSTTAGTLTVSVETEFDNRILAMQTYDALSIKYFCMSKSTILAGTAFVMAAALVFLIWQNLQLRKTSHELLQTIATSCLDTIGQ